MTPKKLFLFCVLAIVLSISTVNAQSCQMYTKLLRRGERVCQRMCKPRNSAPEIRCFTSRFGERIKLCPNGCCRDGSRCRQMA